MKYFLFYAVTLLGGLWLQVIQNHFIGGSLFSVQFLVIASIYWGLTHGPLAGSRVIGFSWGLLSDAASSGWLLGERALLFAAVGISASGFLRRQLDDTKTLDPELFLRSIASFGVVLGELFIEHFFAGPGQRPVSLSVWLQPVWNALAAPLLFLALNAWDLLWDSSRERILGGLLCGIQRAIHPRRAGALAHGFCAGCFSRVLPAADLFTVDSRRSPDAGFRK